MTLYAHAYILAQFKYCQSKYWGRRVVAGLIVAFARSLLVFGLVFHAHVAYSQSTKNDLQLTMLNILSEPNQPVTTQALEFLLKLDDRERALILDPSKMATSEAARKYSRLNSLDANLKHTPLPKSLKHTLVGKILAEDIAKFLGDPSINIEKL